MQEAAHWALLYYLAGKEYPAALPKPKVKPRPLLTAGLAAGSVVLSVLLLEAGVRISMGGYVATTPLLRPDPACDFSLVPGYSGRITLPIDDLNLMQFPARVSSQGLRDREYGPKGEAEFRILMLGDSFTFGWDLSEPRCFVRLLETRLNQAHLPKRITVINAGVPGFCPWQERNWLLKYGLSFQPDLVMLQCYAGNDVSDTLSKQPEKMIRLETYNEQRLFNAVRCQNQDRLPVKLDQWLRVHSFAYHLVANKFFNAFPLTELWAWMGGLPPRARPAGRVYCYDIDLAAWYPELNEAWTTFEQDILQVRQECRNRGIDFAVYNIPYPLNVYKAIGYFEQQQDEVYVLDKGSRMLESFYQDSRLPYIPILDGVRSYPLPPALDYPLEPHLSEVGNEIITKLLANYLLNTYFPSKGMFPVYDSAFDPAPSGCSAQEPPSER
jgi:hypothetical protein